MDGRTSPLVFAEVRGGGGGGGGGGEGGGEGAQDVSRMETQQQHYSINTIYINTLFGKLTLAVTFSFHPT